MPSKLLKTVTRPCPCFSSQDADGKYSCRYNAQHKAVVLSSVVKNTNKIEPCSAKPLPTQHAYVQFTQHPDYLRPHPVHRQPYYQHSLQQSLALLAWPRRQPVQHRRCLLLIHQAPQKTLVRGDRENSLQLNTTSNKLDNYTARKLKS